MTRSTMKYYLQIARKGYKNIPAPFGLAYFVLIALAGLLVFVLLVYEPANEWRTTTFTLSHYEYRYSRGCSVLDLYTTDNKHYVVNNNAEIIQYQLKEGQQYKAVYSVDFIHNIIKGLSDAEREYLNADKVRESNETERFWFSVLLIICVLLLLILNSVYTISYVRAEEEKRRQRTKRR